MPEDIITISAGAPPSDIEAGVYEVTLIDITEPRTIFPQSGPNAGKEVQLRDWKFSLEDGTEVTGSASTASGPKSKTYGWLTALLGGTPPVIGQSYPKSQLIGREALATIAIDADGGWARITNLSARPKATNGARPRPVAPVTVPVATQPVAAQAAADDLPF